MRERVREREIEIKGLNIWTDSSYTKWCIYIFYYMYFHIPQFHSFQVEVVCCMCCAPCRWLACGMPLASFIRCCCYVFSSFFSSTLCGISCPKFVYHLVFSMYLLIKVYARSLHTRAHIFWQQLLTVKRKPLESWLYSPVTLASQLACPQRIVNILFASFSVLSFQ